MQLVNQVSRKGHVVVKMFSSLPRSPRAITHCGGFYVDKLDPMNLVILCPVEQPGLYASSWDTVFHPFETDLWFLHHYLGLPCLLVWCITCKHRFNLDKFEGCHSLRPSMHLWKIWTFSHTTVEPCVTKGSCRCQNGGNELLHTVAASTWTSLTRWFLWMNLCPVELRGLYASSWDTVESWDRSLDSTPLSRAAKSACGGVSDTTLGSTWTNSRGSFSHTLPAFMRNLNFF